MCVCVFVCLFCFGLFVGLVCACVLKVCVYCSPDLDVDGQVRGAEGPGVLLLHRTLAELGVDLFK